MLVGTPQSVDHNQHCIVRPSEVVEMTSSHLTTKLGYKAIELVPLINQKNAYENKIMAYVFMEK